MNNHRFNGGNTPNIGIQRNQFLKNPSLRAKIDTAIPIWEMIGIDEEEYNIRFNKPIEDFKEVKEQVKEQPKEEIKENEPMYFDARPSLVKKSKSLKFKNPKVWN